MAVYSRSGEFAAAERAGIVVAAAVAVHVVVGVGVVFAEAHAVVVVAAAADIDVVEWIEDQPEQHSQKAEHVAAVHNLCPLSDSLLCHQRIWRKDTIPSAGLMSRPTGDCWLSLQPIVERIAVHWVGTSRHLEQTER